MSITNGNNYYIYSNFLGNTFSASAFNETTKTYWYGFERQGYGTQQFLGDAIDIINCWLFAVLLVFFFNFVKSFFPKEPYFVNIAKIYKYFAFYKGFAVCYTKIMLCALMNLVNIGFGNALEGTSAMLACLFFVRI